MANKQAVGFNGYPLPVGSVISFLGSMKPAGFLVCDGALVLKSDYPQLFNSLGNIYGVGTATQFNLPDLVGYFVKGSTTNTNIIEPASAGTGGVQFSINEAEMPPFATNSSNAINFSTTMPHNLITTSNGLTTVVGSPANQTYNDGYVSTVHPAPSITLSAETASYTGTGSVQNIPLTTAPQPANYIVQYCIRADY